MRLLDFFATLYAAMQLVETVLFWATLAVYGLGVVALPAGFALFTLTARDDEITEAIASPLSQRDASLPDLAHPAWREFLARPTNSTKAFNVSMLEYASCPSHNIGDQTARRH